MTLTHARIAPIGFSKVPAVQHEALLHDPKHVMKQQDLPLVEGAKATPKRSVTALSTGVS